nr:MAG TPA: hypothetical protein [Caudoviricetes sp.]
MTPRSTSTARYIGSTICYVHPIFPTTQIPDVRRIREGVIQHYIITLTPTSIISIILPCENPATGFF